MDIVGRTERRPFSKRTTTAIITAASLFFVWLIASSSNTWLINPVPPALSWPITLFSASVGILLGFQLFTRAKPGAERQYVHLMVIVVIVGGIAALFGAGIAQYVANRYYFRDGPEEIRRLTLPISVVGIGRGAQYYVSVEGITKRLTISRGDYALLTGATGGNRSTRYCLPVIFEFRGQAARMRLPRAPRPSRSRRTITIVPCGSGRPLPIVID